MDKWERAIEKDPLQGRQTSAEEKRCFFRRIAADKKVDTMIPMIYALSFTKRKFSELKTKEQLKEVLPFLTKVISSLNDEKGKPLRLQEQIESLKIGESLLRQQAMLR